MNLHPDNVDDGTPEPLPEPCCDIPLVWDPLYVGRTVAGHMVKGWLRCMKCGGAWLSGRGRDAEDWRLAKGGRSIEMGCGKLRADGAKDVEAVMQRIVRLPELELALQRIARGDKGAVAIARRALGAAAEGEQLPLVDEEASA